MVGKTTVLFVLGSPIFRGYASFREACILKIGFPVICFLWQTAGAWLVLGYGSTAQGVKSGIIPM